MAATKSVGFLGSLRRFAFRMSGYNQYGLYHDDCLYENDDVKEALRRLPQSFKDDRNYRMHRAIHLSMSKTILPKNEWHTYEQDHNEGRYLQPFLQEVIQERKEREAWNKK